MSVQTAEREAILARLDAIAQEIEAIRRVLTAGGERPAEEGNLTERLLGCLGEEPLSSYDFSLDWQRFGGQWLPPHTSSLTFDELT